MVKSDHTYGWNGLDRPLGLVELDSTRPVRWSIGTPEGTAGVGLSNLIVRHPDGRLAHKATRGAFRENLGNIISGYGLPMIEIDRGRRMVLPSNEQTGWNVTLGKGDLNHMATYAKSEADFLAIGAVPDLWRTACYVKTEDWKPRHSGQIAGDEPHLLGVHHFTNEIKIKGQHYDVKITVRETRDGKNYYHHQLSKKKEPGSVLGGDASSEALRTGTPTLPSSAENIAQPRGLVNNGGTSDGSGGL